MDSFQKNQTRKLVPRSEACNILTPKRVSAVNDVPESKGGIIQKSKVRIAACDFQSVKEIECNEKYSSVVKLTSGKFFMASVAHQDLATHQIDVKTSFQTFEVEEGVCMERPKVFTD